jgi:hypothetical protein
VLHPKRKFHYICSRFSHVVNYIDVVLFIDLKKIILFLLVSFFILNSAGVYLILEIHRYRINARMEKNPTTEKAFMLSISREDMARSVIRLTSNEISFQGNLYDVIREIGDNDHVHFYCIQDTEEENLASCMHKIGGNKLVMLLLNDFLKIQPDDGKPSSLPLLAVEMKYPALVESIQTVYPPVFSPPPERS